MASKIIWSIFILYGSTEHLPASITKQLKRLESRKFDPSWVITPEVSRALWQISLECGRQVGIMVDRKGVVQAVIVGEPEQITIPVLPRFKVAPSKLKGLRFIRTSLSSVHFDNDDISDLAFLRLDSISVLSGNDQGVPSVLRTAHLLPPTEYDNNLVPHRFFDNSSPHHNNVDYQDFIAELESEISSKTKSLYTVSKPNAAILVGSFNSKSVAKEHMQELAELARSSDVEVLDIVTQIKDTVHPKYIVGPGKLKEIMIACMLKGADFIIFDNILSPAQGKAITEMAEIKIIDRTQLILDIFAKRAISNEGKIRVELAQLRYILPRLTSRDDSLSRLTGGIGGRGPGETKLEIDRRRVFERLSFLTNRLKKIEQVRVTQRGKRDKRALPLISIVGYTNAGKSTLLNTLTKSDVYADNKLFATLDTSSKRIRFPQEREVIITDTVGFIRDLPKDLVGAFKSTLEELFDADLLLHVVDISSDQAAQHIRSVETILYELGLMEKEVVLVFNKADIATEEQIYTMTQAYPEAIIISAIDRKSLTDLTNILNYIIFRSGKIINPPYDE